MAKRKTWTQTITEHGIKVRLFERGGVIYRDVTIGRVVSASGRLRTAHDIQSLKHSNRTLAEKQAEALCAELALIRLNGGADDESLTLGRLFATYRVHQLRSLSPARQKECETRMAMFLEAWGGQFPIADIDATRVQAYCAARRALKIVAPDLRLDDEGKPRRGYRKPQPVRDGALDGEFRFLNAALNWACGFKTQGRPLLGTNPLPRDSKARRALGWPVEKNPRRPTAAHDRYTATQQHTDAVDPRGRLRCILALARFTARRESAICALHASDLLLSPERVRAAQPRA
jgi:hypothetical protein